MYMYIYKYMYLYWQQREGPVQCQPYSGRVCGARHTGGSHRGGQCKASYAGKGWTMGYRVGKGIALNYMYIMYAG